MSRRLRLAAVSTVVALAVAGCGGGDEKVAQQPAQLETGYPAVAVPQATAILDAVDRAVAQGNTQRTKASYGSRVAGPALAIALARAKVDNARKVRPGVLPKIDRQRLLVPDAGVWPRTFVAVGTAAGAPTPTLRVLRAPDARAQYALWAELTMLPGATVPQVASPAEGAPAVAPGDTSLAVPPEQVGPRFAEYLSSNGAKSKEFFAPNAFAEQAFTRLAADQRELVGTGAATLASTHAPHSDAPITLRTSDGGALVVAWIQQRYTVSVKPGRTVTVNPALGALANGRTTFNRSFFRLAEEVVAFHVPPSGKGPVTVVAAQKGDVDARLA